MTSLQCSVVAAAYQNQKKAWVWLWLRLSVCYCEVIKSKLRRNKAQGFYMQVSRSIWRTFEIGSPCLGMLWPFGKSLILRCSCTELKTYRAFTPYLLLGREEASLLFSSPPSFSLISPLPHPALFRCTWPGEYHNQNGGGGSSRSCITSTTTTHFYYLTWSITIRTEEEETPASASFPTARLIFCFFNLIFYSSRDIAICGMKSSYRVSNKQARRTMPRELQSCSFTTLPSPSPCQGPRCPQGPQCLR